MLMVILGAGASHDSTSHFPAGWGVGYPNDPDRPPLADDLFHSRFKSTMSRFPDVRSIAGYLHDSVEETLQRLQAEAAENEEIHKQLMAIRHYVPRVVGDCEDNWLNAHGRVTNHGTLLSRIDLWCKQRKERACFVTFNYDTFIEQAFGESTFRLSMRKLDDYISNDTYKVIKLHGSVTWFREVISPGILDVEKRDAHDIARELIERAKDVKLAKGCRVEARNTMGKSNEGPPVVVVPAIAMPTREKLDFECPNEHLNALEECIPFVSKMMVIGWKAKEETFLRMLGGVSRPVLTMVVGRDKADADSVVKDLARSFAGPFKASASTGFSDFVKSRALDEFLFQ